MNRGHLSTCPYMTQQSITSSRVLSEESRGKFSSASLLFRAFATKCLAGTKLGQKSPVSIAFMGDSRMRQVYWSFIRFVDTGLSPGVEVRERKEIKLKDTIFHALLSFQRTLILNQKRTMPSPMFTGNLRHCLNFIGLPKSRT